MVNWDTAVPKCPEYGISRVFDQIIYVLQPVRISGDINVSGGWNSTIGTGSSLSTILR